MYSTPHQDSWSLSSHPSDPSHLFGAEELVKRRSGQSPGRKKALFQQMPRQTRINKTGTLESPDENPLHSTLIP